MRSAGDTAFDCDHVLPKFHYVDFLVTSGPGSFGEVGVMEFGLKGSSRVYRGRLGKVGIVEYGLIRATDSRAASAASCRRRRPSASSYFAHCSSSCCCVGRPVCHYRQSVASACSVRRLHAGPLLIRRVASRTAAVAIVLWTDIPVESASSADI